MPTRLLQTHAQPEVGEEAYDAGAEILYTLFSTHLAKFREADLAPLGHEIIDCFFARGTVENYRALIRGE